MDIKQVQETFKRAGVPQERIDAFLQALGDDSVQKAFTQNFVETSQYHSNLDRMKNEYEGRLSQTQQQVQAWDKWWQDNGATINQLPTYAKKLQAYEAMYGRLDGDATAGEIRQAATATGLTKQEVQELLDQRTAQVASATSTLMKDIAYVTADHQQRFRGEPLDLDKLEEFAAKSNLPLRQAYKEFINPRMEETRKSEFEAAIKAAREEGAKDALSKHKLPVDSRPKEPHPLFDQKVPPKELNDFQQERHSRDTFLEAWNNYTEEAKAS